MIVNEQDESGGNSFAKKSRFFSRVLCGSVIGSSLAKPAKDLNWSNMFALITPYRAKILFQLASTSLPGLTFLLLAPHFLVADLFFLAANQI